MSDLPPAETTAAPSSRKSLVRHTLGVLLGAISVWTVWAIGVTRGAIDPDRVFALHWAVLLPSHTVLLVSVIISALFTSRRRSLRYVFVPVPLVVGFLFAVLAARVVAWDIQFVLTLGFIGAASAVGAAILAPTRQSRRGLPLIPFFALGLIFLTQLISPKAPTMDDVRQEYAMTGIGANHSKHVTPGPGCKDFTNGLDRTSQYENQGNLMAVSTICNDVAARTIAVLASDGCYSRTEAYTVLSWLAGPHANNWHMQKNYAQRILTSAWLHRANRMDTGFCLKTYSDRRVAVSPAGETLFTVSEQPKTSVTELDS